MQVNIQQLVQFGAATLAGGTGWMVFSAIWRHAPVKFPRNLDDWWGWFRGANQEIAAQHNGGGNFIPPDPTMPVNPAQPAQ